MWNRHLFARIVLSTDRSIRKLFSLVFVASILLNLSVGTVSAGRLAAPLLAVNYNQLAILTPTIGGSAQFGSSLAIQGSVAVVGAPNTTVNGNAAQGAVYIYYRDQGGTDTWGLVKQLVASDGNRNDLFGYSVAIDGDTIVVGARGATSYINPKATTGGAAYVFQRDYPTPGAWGQRQILNSSDEQKGDQFGTSVVISGNIIMSSAPMEDPTRRNAGSAYIFVRPTATGQFTQVGKLSGTQSNDQYGSAMAMDAMTLVVGAPKTQVNGLTAQGQAYVYSYWKDANGVYQFRLDTQLTSSPAAANDNFGASVALSNSVLAIGAPGNGSSMVGSAYLYSKNTSGVWTSIKRETPSTNQAGSWFGKSVALDGDLLLVGAPYEDVGGASNVGAVYVFARNQNTLNSWSESGMVRMTGGVANDNFGMSTGLSGETLLGGMPYKSTTGVVYVLRLTFPIEIDLNGSVASSIDYYTTYTEDTAAVPIADPTTAFVSSLTSSPMDSMVVTISNLLNPGFEILAASPTTGIPADSIVYDASTGTLTIDPPGTAPLSSFNTVLRSVTYLNTSQNPDPIQRVIRFWVTDGTNSNLQSPGAYVTIQPVNDAPGSTASAPLSTNEETTFDFNSTLAITDPDSGIYFIRISLSVDRGTLTLGSLSGLSFTNGDGADDASMTFTATLADANAALAHMLYAPVLNDSGAASLTVAEDDLGNSGGGGAKNASQTYPLTINPVNDGPTLTVPGPQTTSEDTPLAFPGTILVGDIDAGMSPIMVTLSPSNGLPALAAGSGVTVVQTTPDFIFTGTVEQVNAALNGMTFTPAADYNGPASLNITVNDQGATGTPGPLTSSKAIAITVTSVNDAPVLNLPTNLSTNEDTPLTFTSLSISDVDASQNSLQVSLSVFYGTLTLVNPGALVVTGSGTAELTITGEQDALNAMFLNGVVYTPATNATQADTLSVTVNDQGYSGDDNTVKTTSGTGSITITAVNDPPHITLPGAQTVNQYNHLVINSQIQVSDVDANTVQVTLSASHGTLTLTSTTGLSFDTGTGANDPAMVFTGALAAVNTALAQVIYTPTGSYIGPDTLVAEVSDLGNTGQGGVLEDSGSFDITVASVDNAPTISVPLSFIVPEGSSLSITSPNAISISDPDAGTVQMTLSVSHGTLTLGSATNVTFTSGDGDQDESMTFTGSVANVNAALAQVTYVPASEFFGPDVLNIMATDLDHPGQNTNTAEAALTVSAINDAPALIVPGGQTTVEDTALVFSVANNTAILVSDVDAGANPVEITLSAAHGTLNLAATTNLTSLTGNGTAAVTFRGALVDANAALNGLAFLPDTTYYGPDGQLTITVDDLGNTGTPGPLTDSKTIAITVTGVNNAPKLTLPGSLIMNEDTTVALGTITVADVDAGSGKMDVTITAHNGKIDPINAVEVTFSGTLLVINDSLKGLAFVPDANYAGSTTVDVSVTDNGNTGDGGPKTASGSIAITVNALNDAPTVTLPAALATDEDLPLDLTGISVADVDAGTSLVQVTVTVTRGTLNEAGDSSVTFTDTLANINTALGALKYTPNPDFNGPDKLNVAVNDQGNTGAGGEQITGRSVTIDVAAVNDGPVIASLPGAQTVDENQPINFSGADIIQAGDPDSGTDPIQVTLTAGHGSLSLSTIANLVSVIGDETGSVTFQGALANVNQALNGLTYQPAGYYNGADKISISVDDLGHNGKGIQPPANGEISITINPINSAPTAISPTSGEVREDAAVGSTVTAFTAADPDAGDTFTFALVSGPGCDQNAPFHVDGSTLVTTATLDFETTASYTVCVEVTDLGGLKFTQPVTLSVLNVNEAPANHLPASPSTNEDTSLTLTAISVSDVDAGQNNLKVTLAVSHGTLSLVDPGGLIITGSGSAIVTITGGQAALNTVFGKGLSYSPVANYNGPETLSISTSDQGASGAGSALVDTDTLAIAINPVNDAPANHLPANQLVDEDTQLKVTGLSISDIDAGQSQLTVSLAVEHGTLALSDASGVTQTGSGTSALTVSGGLDALNSALAKGLLYNPAANFNGADTLTISTSDQGATGAGGALTDTDKLAISVNPVKDDVSVTITGVEPTPGTIGVPFTVSFSVTSQAGVPGSSVTVSVAGNSATCVGSLDAAGHGSCIITLMKEATYSLTAAYGGDLNFLAGQSRPYGYVVKPRQFFMPLITR